MKFALLFALGVASFTAATLQPGSYKTSLEGHNQFAQDVYKEIRKSTSKNFIVSPLSAEIVLALAYAGSGGRTADQLSSALHFPQDVQALQKTFRQLIPSLRGNQNYTLITANKMFVKKGYEIQETYKRMAREDFGADVEDVNFENTQEAASIINKWVGDKTNDQIKNLIDSRDLNDKTRLILVNAMYFKGQWLHSFSKRATRKQGFHLENDGIIQLEMMRQTNALNYYQCDKTQASYLELPYEGKEMTMTFVLPNDKNRMVDLEERITDVIDQTKYKRRLVAVTIPKFKIETTTQFKPILQSLGVKDAFEDYAKFDGILEKEQLKIDKIVQKAFLEVKESGALASAASAVHIPTAMSGLYEPPPIINFIANHSFIYYIKKGDIVLFIGKYSGER